MDEDDNVDGDDEEFRLPEERERLKKDDIQQKVLGDVESVERVCVWDGAAGRDGRADAALLVFVKLAKSQIEVLGGTLQERCKTR